MVSKRRTSIHVLAISVLVPQICVVMAAGEGTGSLMARIIVTVRKKRSELWDFTELNRNVCPPSLCRTMDEGTDKSVAPRPRGTGGSVFYQGDIVLDNKMIKYIYPEEKSASLRRGKRATMKVRRRLWKDGEVVYKMARSISSDAKRVIERAIKHIQDRTCITFREKKSADKDYIRFISEPGCWSQIGRVGGAQMVSLGQGCESLGTAVHEIVHSLGIWHEQARFDRDKYVKILEENISEKFKPDFEIVSKRVATGRGYPYDYHSLMHYSKYAFTRNGEPTIEVIGVGEKLGLRIGQRKELSTIDISQLRDMYKCNRKTDSEETVCHKGWIKHHTTCYKFFPDAREQFGPAHRSCESLRSHLLTIDDSNEQKFLNKILDRKFKNVYTWRTAGRRVDDHMVWYLGKGTVRNITKYTNWVPNHPSTYTSAIIRKDYRTNEYKWMGEWVGSANLKPMYSHAYICEKPAKRKCVEGTHSDGRDYRGELDHTREGYTCQKWTENYPHKHPLVDAAREGADAKDGEDRDGLGDHNKCRNPSSIRRNRPWCFTSKAKHEWGYCDVSICANSIQQAQRRLRERRGRYVRRRRQRIRTSSASSSSSSSSSSSRTSSLSSNARRALLLRLSSSLSSSSSSSSSKLVYPWTQRT